MRPPRFDTDQRFSCRQCGVCCRRPWDIALTAGEVEGYRHADARRWFREGGAEAEGATADPFEPVPGQPSLVRIRKRQDGACGFLSPDNRCRLHEELGAERKPLTCRLFPYRFHPADGPGVLTASFCCPTVVANEGAPLGAQLGELGRLQRQWFQEYPEVEARLLFVRGRSLPAATLATLRSVLREMLEWAGTDGAAADLPANVGRMAALLEDLQRSRVVQLAPERFAEYVELTGRHAVRADQRAAPRRPSRLGRILFRGFLFAVAASRLQLDSRRTGLRLGLRFRLLRLLLHSHGLGPGVGGYDFRRERRARLDLADPALRALAHNYLRATIETLGTGRRPVVEEMTTAVAFLDAACVLASMRAAQAGSAVVTASALAEGLMEAVDLTHAAARGPLASFLGTLAGNVEALYLFAAGAAEA